MLHRQSHGCQAHDRVSIFSIQFNSNSSTTQQYTDILTDPFKEYATNTKIQYWLQLPTITCVMDSLDTSVC